MPEVAEPPPTVQTPPAAHPGAVTIDLGNLSKKPAPVAKVETPPVVETPPAAEKPPEAVKPPEVVPPAKPNDKDENMANLRKAREAAENRAKEIEAERDRLKTEFEEFKTKPPELPEDVKTRLTKAEQIEKELEESRRLIRQTDLSRDPEFQAKYNRPITERISTMGQIAIAAGVPEADWKAASANWNQEQFGEWAENMTPAQKIRFQTAWMGAEDLWQAQQAELQNADKSYQELQKKRQADAEAQQKQYLSQNEQLAKSVMAEFIKPETLKEYEDLGPSAEAIVLKAARHEMPAKDIFQQLVANQVLSRVTVKQKSRIDELEAALVERDKKISEQDAFIANQAGAVPRGDAAGATTATGKTGPIWQNIVVKTPG